MDALFNLDTVTVEQLHWEQVGTGEYRAIYKDCQLFVSHNQPLQHHRTWHWWIMKRGQETGCDSRKHDGRGLDTCKEAKEAVEQAAKAIGEIRAAPSDIEFLLGEVERLKKELTRETQ